MKKLLLIIVLFIFAFVKPMQVLGDNDRAWHFGHNGFVWGVEKFLPPVITTFSPKNAGAGTIVTITGTDFTETTSVTFGGVAAQSFTINSGTTITAVVAVQSVSGSVAVTSAGGTVSLSGFTFFPTPVITSFAPTTATRGTIVTITGTNFNSISNVYFGNMPAASFTVLSPTTISAVLSSGGKSGNVIVAGTGGGGELAGFTYIAPPPVITAVTTPAKPGGTVQITGSNFENASSVTFGGVNAVSFRVLTSTTIFAVVGTGASGNVEVTTPGGTASKSGFQFIVTPYIISYTPTAAKTGDVIQITGAYFNNISSVSFGGTSSSPFTVISPTAISATVSLVSQSGSVIVVGSSGTYTLAGFTFVPTPTIIQPLSTTFSLGSTINLSTPGNGLFTYQWFKDGVAIPTATGSSYGVTVSGSYTVASSYNGVTATSSAVTLYAVLPNNNFKIAAVSATCKGSNNGAINITAVQPGDFSVAVINNLGNTVFSAGIGAFTEVPNLAPGIYNVCVTVIKQPSTQQCFTVKVAEPKDLALYTTINKTLSSVDLSLSGAGVYNIDLNGVKYTDTTGYVTLMLKKGVNDIMVSSDKPCQVPIQKRIIISDDISAYPNPFTNSLNIDLGSKAIGTALIQVYSSFGKLVYHQQFVNKAGAVNLDLSSLAPSQIYVLKLTADGTEYINKIVKK